MEQTSFYNTKEFQDLHMKWRQILMETGFKDLEKNESSENVITPQMFKDPRYGRNLSRARNAQILVQLTFELEKWPDGSHKEHHRQILELYAEGKTVREIAKVLEQNPDKRTHVKFQGIARVVNRYLARIPSIKEKNGNV